MRGDRAVHDSPAQRISDGRLQPLGVWPRLPIYEEMHLGRPVRGSVVVKPPGDHERSVGVRAPAGWIYDDSANELGVFYVPETISIAIGATVVVVSPRCR